MIAAAAEMDVPTVDDLNSIDGAGFGYQPRNIWKGKRQSAAKVFLRPAMQRPNLTVITDTDVLRLTHEGRRITGVRIRNAGGERDIRPEERPVGQEGVSKCISGGSPDNENKK